MNALIRVGDFPVEVRPAGGYRHGATFITAESAYAAKVAGAERYSPDWLAIAAQFCADRDAALDVPPTGDSLTNPVQRFVTPGGAGSDRPLAVERAVTEDSAPAVASSGPAVHLPQVFGGTASGLSLNPPEHDGPDAAKACYRREGVGVPVVVGTGTPTGGRAT